MGHKRKRANVPAGHDSPLNYAISARDRSVIDMVDQAVRHKQVMLAYQFITEIETMETGRVIDCLALEKGLRTLQEFPDLRLSVNMSARSIGYPRWNSILKRGLGEDPTVAERLILEITESSAMLVPDLVVGFMDDLQKKGISFALDDFGAGFTSFRYLK
jgi:EAL domain-containing protein (putative c-di-GMP-specific phosphodiesterase class I)